MNITLMIRSDDGYCDKRCCFFHQYPNTNNSECFLFNELLRKKETGNKSEQWQSCHNCIQVCNKIESQDLT